MVANKKEIGGPNGFERLLKYYVKLTLTGFIKQWVSPKLYNGFLLEIFSSHVTLLNDKKDCPHFQCCIMEGNGQVNCDFLIVGLTGGRMVILTQEQINPSLSKCFLMWLMPNYRNR
jgi:hypothetical protein